MILTYLKHQEEYSQKYGDKTIVLMQVGSFMEFYEYDPEKSEQIVAWPTKKLGLVTEATSLLNIMMTMKDKKKPYNLSNTAMAGFPIVSYEKHRDVLLNNNYTIVKIEQRNTESGIDRIVTEILSPTTSFENIANIPITNNIVSIYVEILKETFLPEDYVIVIGLSCIDVTTGENKVLEIYSQTDNAVFAIQELYRYLSITKPKEVLLTLTSLKNTEYDRYLIEALKLDNCIVNKQVDKEYLKIEYQTNFLSKVFTTSKNIIEDLSLERIYYGTISYIILLQFCYEHNPICIEKLYRPNTSWIDGEKYLILTHNAIDQLDLMPGKNKAKHNRKNKVIDSLFFSC